VVDAFAGQAIGQQVRDQQSRLHPVQAPFQPVDRELIQRVERQELQAILRIQRGERNAGVHGIHPLCGPLVAVVERLVDQLSGAQ
jgi:hypothetical protein